MNATGVTAGPAESNGRLLLSKWRDSLHVTCGLTACTPGSAPGQTLGNEYGKTLLFTSNIIQWTARNSIKSDLITHTPARTHTHTHLTALCLGLLGWAGTRKVKPIWILLKQETVSGSGIRWDICKYAPRSRQITMSAPHRSVFYRPDALPDAQPTASKHWRQKVT